jgi:hypothetical protein
LQHRSSRVVATLAALPAPKPAPALGLDTELTHTEVAFCHLTASPDTIDFSHPGGHLYVHRGAEPGLLYMVNTPKFRVRDVPGEMADEVRLSLAAKLVQIGFLKPV